MSGTDLFTISIEGVSSEIRLLSFHGSEGMSQLFDYHVDLVSPDADIDFEEVIGKPALLTMETDDAQRFVHGIVSRFEVTGSEEAQTHYGATIVPSLWTLGLRQDSCIFQDMTTPEIIQDVLESAGMADGTDFEISAQGSFPAHEYCVQYRETDFAFISRLMEEDGLFYFFEHTDSGHKLVVGNATSHYPLIPGDAHLKFRAAGTGLTTELAEVRNLRFARSMSTGRVELRAWNFTKTDLDLKQEKEAEAEANLEHYDYAGRYGDGDLGGARTAIRLEALRTRFKVLSGESNCRRMLPGHRFTVEEHARESMNGEYVLTRVSHSGAMSGSGGREAYRNSFEAIPAEVLFRAPQITPRGCVDGPQTAIVTGPAGEEIHVDSHGRVKVQFHWDRYGANDDKSSCWVRVSQMWAGGAYGALVIPRIGHEVIVDFLEGDPDQPIIVGRVYNGGNLVGYDLPADKTRTSLKSYSSPGGNGFNEMRFEDAAGSEEIFMHAQKDMNSKILNNRTTDIGTNHTHTVGNNETMKVVKNRTRDVGGNENITIGGNHTESVAKNRSLSVDGAESIVIAKDESVSVEGGRSTSISKDDKLSIGAKQVIDVGADSTESISGKLTQTVTKSVELTYSDVSKISIGKDSSIEITGNSKQKVGKAMKIEAGDEITIECGSAKIILKKNGDITFEGGKINVKASSDLTLKGSKVAAN